MNTIREEILPGVFFNHTRSDKFKTACMSVCLLTQLEREHAFPNALIPYVLKRGTISFPDMEALSNHLDDLYGSAIEPCIRRIGEIQCIGLFASFPESAFLPHHEDILGPVCNLLGELLLRPNMENGKFLSSYVDSEKQNLADAIRSSVNDKRVYALKRCVEEMCPYEDYAAGRCGKAEDADFVDNASLTEQYRTLLQSSPMEIFYVGRQDFKEVADSLRTALKGLPRKGLNYDIGTDIRMNALEEQPRYFEEHMDVTQGKLVMGYRLGECMNEPDTAILSVFNTCFGSGCTSKLFVHVREEKSLCYYAFSTLDKYKGLLLVSSGIDFQNYEVTRQEIERQLQELRSGNLTEEELNSAKNGVVADLISLNDHPADLEAFLCTNAVTGNDITIEKLADQVAQVTKEQVVEVARSVEEDLVYYLRNDL